MVQNLAEQLVNMVVSIDKDTWENVGTPKTRHKTAREILTSAAENGIDIPSGDVIATIEERRRNDYRIQTSVSRHVKKCLINAAADMSLHAPARIRVSDIAGTIIRLHVKKEMDAKVPKQKSVHLLIDNDTRAELGGNYGGITSFMLTALGKAIEDGTLPSKDETESEYERFRTLPGSTLDYDTALAIPEEMHGVLKEYTSTHNMSIRSTLTAVIAKAFREWMNKDSGNTPTKEKQAPYGSKRFMTVMHITHDSADAVKAYAKEHGSQFSDVIDALIRHHLKDLSSTELNTSKEGFHQ